ncbi:hypothetical protein ACFL9T_01695 [Thermodesulfobacteriota bacterium]
MENLDALKREIEKFMDELQWDFEFLSSQALDRVNNLPFSLDDLNIDDAETILAHCKDIHEEGG